jgi:hypothetical protein
MRNVLIQQLHGFIGAKARGLVKQMQRFAASGGIFHGISGLRG